jgi:hypothetical protein
MGKFIIRIWRVFLDIHGSYALIRQIVGSSAVTVLVGKFVWYWGTLPVGLRVLLVIALFGLTWLIIAFVVKGIRELTWYSIMKRIKQDRYVMKILNMVEAMDRTLSKQLPEQIKVAVPTTTRHRVTDEFIELFGIKVGKYSNAEKKYKHIVIKAIFRAFWEMSFNRRQLLINVATLLTTNGIGFSYKDYDSLNEKLDKSLKFAHHATSHAVYEYLDYSKGINSLVLFMERDVDIKSIKRYFPSFLWLKIKEMAYRRDQIMRILYNQLALTIASKR